MVKFIPLAQGFKVEIENFASEQICLYSFGADLEVGPVEIY